MMLNWALWERSGHWDHFIRIICTTVIDEEDFAVKLHEPPPGGMLVYKSEPHSYRDPPCVGELGLRTATRCRSLHGLFRCAALPRTTPTSS